MEIGIVSQKGMDIFQCTSNSKHPSVPVKNLVNPNYNHTNIVNSCYQSKSQVYNYLFLNMKVILTFRLCDVIIAGAEQKC